MKHEYEAQFLAVVVADLQARLKTLGAAQAFPRTLLARKIFENGTLEGAPGSGSAMRAPGPR
jgi:adenylate cyclase, class 2